MKTHVLACERCLKVPATAYDTYANMVVCADCGGLGDEESAYACEFMLGYIPERVLAHSGNWPTIEVAQ